MSLCNALFGVNPFSTTLLEMLGTEQTAIPRYRDCFLNHDGSEIVIHTRTGGGNRDFYENEDRCRASYPEYFNGTAAPPTGPWNDDLRKIAGFKCDKDDNFDCTYANFHYSVPEAFKEQIALLKSLGAVTNPAERWQTVLDGLRNGDTSKPEIAHALAVGEKILGQIKEAMDKGQGGITTV